MNVGITLNIADALADLATIDQVIPARHAPRKGRR